MARRKSMGPSSISIGFATPKATKAPKTTITAGRAYTEALKQCTNSPRRAAGQQYPKMVITKPRAWMQTLLVTGYAKRVSREVVSYQQGRAKTRR